MRTKFDGCWRQLLVCRERKNHGAHCVVSFTNSHPEPWPCFVHTSMSRDVQVLYTAYARLLSKAMPLDRRLQEQVLPNMESTVVFSTSRDQSRGDNLRLSEVAGSERIAAPICGYEWFRNFTKHQASSIECQHQTSSPSQSNTFHTEPCHTGPPIPRSITHTAG